MIPLCTIGYTGLRPEALIGHLKAAGVEVVWDVRESAWSRHPAWRRAELQELVEGGGLRYEHRHGLGNRHRHSSAPMAEIFEAYRADLRRVGAPHDLAREIFGGRGPLRVALLCGCQEAAACHRRVLAEEIRACSPTHFEITHLPPTTGDLFA